MKRLLRKQHRRKLRQQGENKAAGNPSPHNPNLQPECAYGSAFTTDRQWMTLLTITPLNRKNQIIDRSLYYRG
jgi:hypothetical protein